MSSYYGVKKVDCGNRSGYCGRVYHFDMTGEKEIEQFRGPVREIKERAVDDAAEWLEDENLEAASDGSW